MYDIGARLANCHTILLYQGTGLQIAFLFTPPSEVKKVSGKKEQVRLPTTDSLKPSVGSVAVIVNPARLGSNGIGSAS